jgi:outer membrane protein assembly factor BamB
MPPLPEFSRSGMIAATLTLMLIFVCGALVYGLTTKPGNVSNPNVEFVATQPPAKVQPVSANNFSWPLYGYDKARTRYLPIKGELRPPFGRVWRLGGSTLLEFPPVICGENMFLMKNTGSLYAIRREDGYLRWTRNLGKLAASAPACGSGTVYAVILQRGRQRSSDGRVVALRAKTGALLWSKRLPARTESSPLLHRGRIYFGSEDGRVYALDAKTGKVKWIYKSGGAVKGALAMDGGKLYFGDYAGNVTALQRATGKKVWQTGTGGSGPLGAGGGSLYSTPAVAYGRVYIGSTNGFVYSFSSRNGKLAWRHKTGGYVYASPAVGPAKGGTVYIGSYDGTFYALNARSGNVRWSRNAGGKLSGAAIVLGDTVLYANLGRRSLALVRADNGRLLWSRNNGGFDPGVSDGKHLYLLGYSMLQTWQERKRH